MATRRSEELDAARWVLPAADYRVTARFGQTSYLWSTTHTGVDLAAPTGTPVYAVGGGVVIFAAYDGPYGNKVVVRHEDDTETWYAHLDSIDAAAGQSVAAGDQVGRMGSTGNVTGPHLHLEVRPSGLEPVDPLDAMSDRGVPLE